MKLLLICAAAILATATSPAQATTFWQFNVSADLIGTRTTYTWVDYPVPDATTSPLNQFVNFDIVVPAFDTNTDFAVGGREVPPCDALGMFECYVFGTLRFDNRSIFIDSMTFFGTGYVNQCNFLDCYPYSDIEGDTGSGIATFVVSQDGPAPVPEPGTWAMTLLGFGAVGWGMRRRSKSVARSKAAFRPFATLAA